MKKSDKVDLIATLKLAKEHPEMLDNAIAKLETSRRKGPEFTAEPKIRGLEAGKWYTLNEKDQVVSVPSEIIRTGKKNNGLKAFFEPYYRTAEIEKVEA